MTTEGRSLPPSPERGASISRRVMADSLPPCAGFAVALLIVANDP
jgi:hypothetical protein